MVLILIAALPPVPALAQEQPDEQTRELLDLVRDKYGPVLGFEADYSLAARHASLAGQGGPTDMETSGRIWFAKPDRLRLNQSRPRVEELVYSPAGYWWYIAETKEAHRFPAGEMAGSIEPFVSFFSGLESIGRWFLTQRMPGQDTEINGEKLTALRLVPRAVKMGLNRVDVLITADGVIRRATIHSLVGDVYAYTFSCLKLLTEPPEQTFFFVPPEGARVIQH